jgi:hypothetical protein
LYLESGGWTGGNNNASEILGSLSVFSQLDENLAAVLLPRREKSFARVALSKAHE